MFYSRWIRNFLLLTTLVFLLVGLTNLAIDPYGVYRLVVIDGVNANKHMGTDHAREVNYYLALKRQARTLMLGNSRVAIGLDPKHPGWPEDGHPVFNLGLPGSAIDEVAVYLDAYLQQQPLKRVVVGIDMIMLSALQYAPDDQSFIVESFAPWSFHINNLFSIHTFSDSLETLRKQNRFKYPDYREDGMMAESFKANRVTRDGYLETFHWAEQNYLEFKPVFIRTNPENGASRYDAFKDILRLAHEHQFELIVFIAPMHARYLELFSFSRLWSKYEDWKRDMVRLVGQHRLTNPDDPPVLLWDFSGYNTITSEAVPPAGDKTTAMKYYWETSHFKKEAGDLVLDRILNYRSPDRPLPDDFGVLLSPDNIEQHLATIRAQRLVYRSQRQDEIRDLESMRLKYWGE